ncbi:MAG TPA: aldehyde ferredoxin oxidoreductase family protein [Candidatus Anoxymicrobiaceae bacterium]
MYGNTGKVLEVDLSSGQFDVTEPEEDTYKKYIGGAGLAAKLLYDRGNLDADALDPEALLIFATGPLADTGMYGTSRLSVGARSPLTGIWGQASCGGNFGPELKRCGYDGIIFKGKSPQPVYLLLGDDSAELVSAVDLWGKDTYQICDELKAKYSKQHKVLAVGPASENGVLYGSICNDYGHHFGRAGMGTVMASKNLKAIVAQGSKRVEFADPEGLKELWQNTVRPRIDDNVWCQGIGADGTAALMEIKLMEGECPVKNWTVGDWMEGGKTLSGPMLTDTILTDRHGCRGCAVKCKRVVEVKEGPYKIEEGPGPELETIGCFGTLLLNPSMESVAKANEICNRLGMDTITCGSTFAWAMDCYDHGVMKPEDYEGIKLEWGDIDTVIELLPKIAAREGKLGELLSRGSRKASEEIGGGSDEFLTDTKGLEAPIHDPRSIWGTGVAYAMSVRGACHVSNNMFELEWGGVEYPEIGLDILMETMSAEHKTDAAIKTTDIGCINNSLCWCAFTTLGVPLPLVVQCVNMAAGYDYDLDSMMKAGGRIWYLQRCLCHIWGVTAEDDRLGKRIMTPTPDGMIAGMVPDMDRMLKEWYEMRDLGPDGKPSKKVLEEYDLGYLADKI